KGTKVLGEKGFQVLRFQRLARKNPIPYCCMQFPQKNTIPQRAKLPVCEGTAGLAGAGGEVGTRRGAKVGAEFKRAGKSRTNVFIEGCHTPLKPKKYISLMA